jgi:hypothetical protein
LRHRSDIKGSGEVRPTDFVVSLQQYPLDAVFLEGLLAKTFEALGRPSAKARFLASTLLKAAHRPPTQQQGQDEALQRHLVRTWISPHRGRRPETLSVPGERNDPSCLP